MQTERPKLKVFFSYSRSDQVAVIKFYHQLKQIGWIDPWLDQENILPGKTWELEILKALEASDIVLVFLTNNSVTKAGYLHKEIKKIVDLAEMKPEGEVFIIPIRLDDCMVPRRLQDLQWVDFLSTDDEFKKERAFSKLLQSLQTKTPKTRTNPHLVEEEISEPPPSIFPAPSTKPTIGKKITVLSQRIKKRPIPWLMGILGLGLCILLAIFTITTLPELMARGLIGAITFLYQSTPTATQSIQAPFIEYSQPTEQTEIPYDVTIIPETPTATSEPQSFSALPGPVSEVKWNSFTSKQLACMSSKYIIPVDGVVSAEFLPGGGALAAQLGSSEPQIGIWNFADNSWMGQIIPGNTLTQTQDGPVYMLVGYEEAEVYSVETGQLVFTAPEPNEDPIGFSASHNGNLFAFGYQSGKVVIYDRSTSKNFTVFSTGLAGSQIVFSQDDRFFATGDRYAPISIWNTETHALVAKLKTQSSFFSFSRDGQYLIYIGYSLDDSAFYILAYNLQDQQVKKIIPIDYIWGERDQVRTYMSIENDLYGFGGNFWELSTNAPIRVLQEHDPYPAVMVTGSLEGDQLISVGYDKMIVWDLSCGR